MATTYHYADRPSSATSITSIPTLLGMGKKTSIALALAGNVQRLMDHHGLSQAQLAKKSGVGQSTLSGLLDVNRADERNPRSSTIDKLAAFFKVEPWQLVVPGLHIELLLNEQVARIIYNFNDAPDAGRANIDRIAESEVRYANSAHVKKPRSTTGEDDEGDLRGSSDAADIDGMQPRRAVGRERRG